MDEIVTRTAKGEGVFKMLHPVLRGAFSLLENSTHTLLTVLNFACKKRVPPIQNDLLLIPATVLAEKIRKAEITSEAVVKAYIQRIGQINEVINAVVEGRYTEAIQEARAADEFIKSGGLSEQELAEQYPLLGIPFTTKEAILIKGLPNTCGLVCRKGMTADEDAESVQRLRACGAIPLAITNTSEICMYWETYNNLHGRTSNPYDITRTVGGSSGGEAALLASAGSVVGVGTDLGGSIRLPAYFCGIFGHKPSQDYVPIGGQYPPCLEEISRYAVIGPMARYVSDLKLMLKHLVGQEGAQKLKLDYKVELRSIKVYYMLDDGASPVPTPVSLEIKALMKQVVDKLSAAGCVTQEVKLKNVKFGFLIWLAYLAEVKEQRIAKLLLGDVKKCDHQPYMELWNWFAGKSEHTFPVVFNACAQEHLAPFFSKLLHFMRYCGIGLKEELLEILGGQDSVFLYPTYPTVAPHHGQMFSNLFNLSYTTLVNAVSLPSTQCPLGLNSNGLPYGLQILTGPSNDRLSLRVAEYLEEKFGGWVPIKS